MLLAHCRLAFISSYGNHVPIPFQHVALLFLFPGYGDARRGEAAGLADAGGGGSGCAGAVLFGQHAVGDDNQFPGDDYPAQRCITWGWHLVDEMGGRTFGDLAMYDTSSCRRDFMD